MLTFEKALLIPEKENTAVAYRSSENNCEKHVHDYFELVYILKGTGRHFIDGREYRVGHGNLLFISKNQTHEITDDNRMQLVNIMLNPEFISRELVNTESIMLLFRHSMFDEFDNVGDHINQCVRFCGNELTETDMLVRMLVNEYNAKEPGYISVLHGGIRILFSRLMRALTNISEQKENEVRLDDIIGYINENYNKKITLSEIAEMGFYNPSYFGFLLKKAFGKSFSAYLKEKRIAVAQDLLLSCDKSVDDIMLLSGYRDKKLFYSHFKEISGTTPGKYRSGKPD